MNQVNTNNNKKEKDSAGHPLTPVELMRFRVEMEEERRFKARKENMRIGSGQDINIPTAESLELNTALDRFIFVAQSSRVVDMYNRSRAFDLSDFHNIYKSSKCLESKTSETKDAISTKRHIRQVTMEWFASNKRPTVDAMTFMAGGEAITRNPEGLSAINLWTGFREHGEIDGDRYLEHIKAFKEHCDFIFGDQSTDFIKWCAHIQQNPGELPQWGWVSIATKTGMGRNWIASVLTRVFAGYVAPSFDLVHMLDTGFNGDLSRKVLAIVDEIHEGGGGSSKWKHAEKIKSMVNSETRLINPKCAPSHTEHNACRWLIFSNHLDAMPLDETDRRFAVVITKEDPKPQSYYSNLYKLMYEDGFIASMAHFLSNEDISDFSVVGRPKLSNDKREMINSNVSDEQEIINEISAKYPYDVIPIKLVKDAIYVSLGENKSHSNLGHCMERAGWIQVKNGVRLSGVKRIDPTRPNDPKVDLGVERVRVIRNPEKWAKESNSALANEASRIGSTSVLEAITELDF